jgi:hypothetical protein
MNLQVIFSLYNINIVPLEQILTLKQVVGY